jgi:hypothetical protein
MTIRWLLAVADVVLEHCHLWHGHNLEIRHLAGIATT